MIKEKESQYIGSLSDHDQDLSIQADLRRVRSGTINTKYTVQMYAIAVLCPD